MQQIEKKLRHPPWYYVVVSRLTRYKGRVDIVDCLLRELSAMGIKTTQVYTDMPHGSGVSDSTGDLASTIASKKKALQEARNEIGIIDYAVGKLSEPKQLIVKVRYLTEFGQDKGASITLRNHAKKHGKRMLNYRVYERMRDEAVRELAEMFGEITTQQ